MQQGRPRFYYQDKSIESYHDANRILHRISGPAVEWPNGEQWWLVKGKLHREDGPAIYNNINDRKDWFLNGQPISILPRSILLKYLRKNRLTFTQAMTDSDLTVRESSVYHFRGLTKLFYSLKEYFQQWIRNKKKYLSKFVVSHQKNN